jgi:hypothetical protein
VSALEALFGYHLEGMMDEALLDPRSSRSRWKFWS